MCTGFSLKVLLPLLTKKLIYNLKQEIHQLNCALFDYPVSLRNIGRRFSLFESLCEFHRIP